MKKIRKDDVAGTYAEATDGCRHLLRVARSSDRQEQRIKPDRETHPEAAFDREEGVLRFCALHCHPSPATWK
jgi:hypothetical protein